MVVSISHGSFFSGWCFGTMEPSWLSIYWDIGNNNPKWLTHVFQRGRAQPPTSISWFGWLGVALRKGIVGLWSSGVIQTPNQTVTFISKSHPVLFVYVYIYIQHLYIYIYTLKNYPSITSHWLSYPNPIISLSNGEGWWYLQCWLSTGKTGYTSSLPYSKCCPNL